MARARGSDSRPPAGPTSRTSAVWCRDSASSGSAAARAGPARDEGRRVGHGWHPLPDGEGLGLLFWRSRDGGNRFAGRCRARRSLAELVARLPATPVARAGGGRTSGLLLSSPLGRLVYQWGAFQPPAARAPACDAVAAAAAGRVAPGLPGAGPGARPGGGDRGGPGRPGGGAGGRPGLWLYRESTRELRQAAQRVSFVNQVSHELKTPLTNVRMYAELLEDHVGDDDDDGRKRLGVVVARASGWGA